jgi:hypothetical protein
MQWIEQLNDTERKAILAATSHSTIDFDFILSDTEFTVAEKIFNDLDRVQNSEIPAGYAVVIPESHHRAIWAATCASVNDIHAPVDNLSGEQWDQLDTVHNVINMWGREVEEPADALAMR